MNKFLFAVLTTLGIFATIATLAGILIDGRFESYGIATAVGYLLATIGFLFLVGWTFLKGHLKDVEAPKYKVLTAESEE